jgi:hypothetical protein
MLHFACPHCRKRLNAAVEEAGRVCVCAWSRKHVQVPAPGAPPGQAAGRRRLARPSVKSWLIAFAALALLVLRFLALA